MTIDLNLWEAKLVLEAIQALDAQWNATIDGTEDEDVQAEYGNDLAQLQMLRERVEEEGCREFGPEIKKFSREPIGAASKGWRSKRDGFSSGRLEEFSSCWVARRG